MSEHKASHLGLIFIRAAVMAGVWAAHFAGWLILGAAYMGGSFECYDHRYENIAGMAFYPLMLVSLIVFSVLCWLPARLLVRAKTLLLAAAVLLAWLVFYILLPHNHNICIGG